MNVRLSIFGWLFVAIFCVSLVSYGVNVPLNFKSTQEAQVFVDDIISEKQMIDQKVIKQVLDALYLSPINKGRLKLDQYPWGTTKKEFFELLASVEYYIERVSNNVAQRDKIYYENARQRLEGKLNSIGIKKDFSSEDARKYKEIGANLIKYRLNSYNKK